jgi:hypothetical protein
MIAALETLKKAKMELEVAENDKGGIGRKLSSWYIKPLSKPGWV